ncbi:MAG: type II toxin-antitoxin system VapC family toxin [Deltaproteobacteria bacterium]|nr:type II toxin-antitoxin system VapC family toxin [Deltaproteobacteria bacterium]
MTAYLADTNVIVRWVLPHDPLSLPARTAVKQLVQQGDTVYVGTQNLMEFWSVATRPHAANGLGMTPAQAAAEVDRIAALFPILDDIPAIYRHWRRLVEACGISGRQVFDARLAALMAAHSVTHILIFNTEDFRRYPGIVVVSPHDVIGSAPVEP